MSSVVQSSIADQQEVSILSASYLLLRHRQKLIEDLWESVLRSFLCGGTSNRFISSIFSAAVNREISS